MRNRPQFESESDNWYEVSDPKERKRIQDRLAQRARRRRLAAANKQNNNSGSDKTSSALVKRHNRTSSNAKSSNSHPCSGSTGHERAKCLAQMRVDIASARRYFKNIDSISPLPSTSPFSPSTSPSIFPSTTTTTTTSPTPDPNMSPLILYAALWINGQPLGQQCVAGTAKARSRPDQRGPGVPQSLWPTDTQLAVEHFTWINRFPFPKFRDNMILCAEFVDAEQFLEDCFSSRSFVLRPGADSWDASAWRMEAEFEERWGWLFV